MNPVPRVPSFDIFVGESDSDAKWLETVEGLGAAVDRMDSIALEKPGLYFVFNRSTHEILARANSKYRYKPDVSDVA